MRGRMRARMHSRRRRRRHRRMDHVIDLRGIRVAFGVHPGAGGAASASASPKLHHRLLCC